MIELCMYYAQNHFIYGNVGHSSSVRNYKHFDVVAEMIKPVISNFDENDFFSFVLTKCCMSIYKDVLLP